MKFCFICAVLVAPTFTRAADIDVARFGAIANDDRDDAPAIRSAIDAAKKGDVIRFAAGRYEFASQVILPNDVKLTGVRGETLIHVADKIHAFKIGDDRGNVSFADLSFDGGVLFIDGKAHDLALDHVNATHFDRGSEIGTGSTGGAIGGAGAEVARLSITNCSFTDSRKGMAFFAFRGEDWLFADNEFINTNGGIKSNNVGATSKRIRIERNYFNGTSRMAVELQGQVDGFWFVDNYYENPVFESATFKDNDSTFAFSLIYHGDSTRDVHILRNVVLAPQRPDGTGVRLAFEVGNNAEVRDNYVNGIGTFVSCFMGDSSGDRPPETIGPTIIENNRVLDAVHGVGSAYGPHARKATIRVNGADAKLSWDITRERPGPDRKRFRADVENRP